MFFAAVPGCTVATRGARLPPATFQAENSLWVGLALLLIPCIACCEIPQL